MTNGEERTTMAAVVTTIQPPTPALIALADRARVLTMPVIVVGDRKTPNSQWPDGCRYLSLQSQKEGPYELGRLLPENHYGRKNLGYLVAISEGVDGIFETDDDNAPLAEWGQRAPWTSARCVDATSWFNVYRCFTREYIWPRGFPLEHVRAAMMSEVSMAPATLVDAPIQQTLVNGSPDVDAVWRLLFDRPLQFEAGESVSIDRRVWCPFNSQSTWWFSIAYPLLYLPSRATFRMTDIWRSFVAQRCLWELGRPVVFHAADMVQDRNRHDLLRDLTDEVPGFVGNARLCDALSGASLSGGPESVPANLHRCYEVLVAAGIVEKTEMSLVEAWLRDLERAAARS